jgi:hypothetical protein
MSATVKNYLVRKIDRDNHVICFNPEKHGKITGSRFLAVIGKDSFMSEFKAACLISRMYSEYEPTKYTEAGDIIEPIIRSYVRDNWQELLGEKLQLGNGDKITVEDPVEKRDCHYDHFGSEPVFGGLVDGYIRINGSRRAVLEIKTSSHRDAWEDGKIPEGYLLQASLYAELSGLDTIVFAVGFLEDEDYDSPKDWAPNHDNFLIVSVHKKDIADEMSYAEEWFRKYILRGMTPKWEDRDAEIVGCFLQRDLFFVDADLMSRIDEYIGMPESDERTDLADEIKNALAEKMTSDDYSIKYEQNGYLFTVTKTDEGYIMTVGKTEL